ncbi:hypothetical protein [Roseofilum sp. Belize BBD 4]|nr:hypothetical protein [Roseofilum sp. Belize BBD 4]
MSFALGNRLYGLGSKGSVPLLPDRNVKRCTGGDRETVLLVNAQ